MICVVYRDAVKGPVMQVITLFIDGNKKFREVFMSEEMKVKMEEIRALEDKYSLMIFRMALTHLVDVGFRAFFDEGMVAAGIEAIMKQHEEDKTKDKTPILSSRFQCEVLRCSAELANFSIWTIFAYIKEYVVVDIT